MAIINTNIFAQSGGSYSGYRNENIKSASTNNGTRVFFPWPSGIPVENIISISFWNSKSSSDTKACNYLLEIHDSIIYKIVKTQLSCPGIGSGDVPIANAPIKFWNYQTGSSNLLCTMKFTGPNYPAGMTGVTVIADKTGVALELCNPANCIDLNTPGYPTYPIHSFTANPYLGISYLVS